DDRDDEDPLRERRRESGYAPEPEERGDEGDDGEDDEKLEHERLVGCASERGCCRGSALHKSTTVPARAPALLTALPHHPPVHDDGAHVAGVLQRVTVEEGEVGVFPR